MTKIVLAFVLSLAILSLIASGSVYLVQKHVLKTAAAQEYSFWQFSLYILGYGDSPAVDAGMQLVLGIVGIIMISLLSACLTIDLFRRAKDVLISNNLVIWQNSNKGYCASILLGNRGQTICNVSVAAQLFDSTGETLSIEDNTFSKPIVISNHMWRVDLPVKIGSFMYEYFHNQYKGDGQMQLYVLGSFIDASTGQESMICKEYRFKDVVAVDREQPFALASSASGNGQVNSRSHKNARWKQFRQVEENASARDSFREFICSGVTRIDMRAAIPIVGGNGDATAMSIMHEAHNGGDVQSMSVAVDFSQHEGYASKPDFCMALVQFLPCQDWGPYHDKNYRLEFGLSASSGMAAVQLEVKDKTKAKILDRCLEPSAEVVNYSYSLREMGDRERWKDVQELCFLVFNRPEVPEQGSFTIKDLRLVEGTP